MQIISGGVDPLAPANGQKLIDAARRYPAASELYAPTRGAMLVSFASDTGRATPPAELPDPVDAGDVATLFSLAFPKSAAPNGRIGFQVRVLGGGAIVKRP